LRTFRRSTALCFVLISIASCVGKHATPGPLTPAPGADQYELTGHYYKDKFYFFPHGRNFEIEAIYFEALREGDRTYEPTQQFRAEANIAIDYDAMAFVAQRFSGRSSRYGIVLGRVGRWRESIEAFQEANPDDELADPEASSGLPGNIGVAQHALGNYAESVSSFEKALSLNATYLDSRPNQMKIFLAAKEGKALVP
jgi:tetratricopeptide (TPR) repeat protein